MLHTLLCKRSVSEGYPKFRPHPVATDWPGCSWHVLLSSTLICTGELTLRVFLSKNPDLSGAPSFYLIALPYFRFFLAVHSLVNWRKGWKCSEVDWTFGIRKGSSTVVYCVSKHSQSIWYPVIKREIYHWVWIIKIPFSFLKLSWKILYSLRFVQIIQNMKHCMIRMEMTAAKTVNLLNIQQSIPKFITFQKVIIVTQWPNHHHNTMENVLYGVVMWPLVWKTWWTGSHGGNFVGDLLTSFFVCFHVE